MFIISNSFLGHYEINLDVGVSNTAGTLNFIKVMSRDDKYIIVGRIFLGIAMVFAFGFTLIVYNIAKDNETRTPVEEIYHRQLVVTLDSILDARFGPGCCEEVIDSDDVSIPQRLFSSQKFVDMVE